MDQFFKDILPPDRESMEKAGKRWDSIVKPLGGLGKLEEMLVRIAGIQRTEQIRLKKRAVIVMCADNGIVEEGVTQSDASVTALAADHIAEGLASINCMCRQADIEVMAVDIGILHKVRSPELIRRRVASGTKNFRVEPAMTETELKRAIDTGISLVKEAARAGYTLLATGEMGIGNTTTGCAVACALLKLDPYRMTGRGAGLSEEGLCRKTALVSEALKRYDLQKKPVEDVLRTVGGLDIAGLAGVFLGGAMYGIPVVIDGMISAVAALAAYRLCPDCLSCMLASHMSREPVMEAVMLELGLEPVIYGDLALGEGTGAALLIPMLDMALAVYEESATFEQSHMEAYRKWNREELC